MSVAGRLLIAPPAMGDPNFAETVVLVLLHNDEGALGVILNRPTDRPVGEVLPLWASRCSHPATLFEGGPVELGSVIALGRHDRSTPADTGGLWAPCIGQLGEAGIGTVNLHLDPDDHAALSALRVFAGYAGWSSAQLDGEIAMGGWLIVACKPSDVHDHDPDTLWSRVLRRQGGDMAIVATYPPDPSLN